MTQPGRKTKILTTSVDVDTLEKIEEMSETLSMSRSRVVREAIEAAYRTFEKNGKPRYEPFNQ